MRYLTDEEVQLASRFLFLSMTLVVIKQDIDRFRQGEFKIKEPYVNLLEKMASEASNERKQLRKKMNKKKLQVTLLTKNDSFSSYLFLCQGKEEKRNYFNPAIRKKVEAIFQELMLKSLSYHHPVASGT
ncbi:hypothetical protein SAMN05216389_1063 [Oceanobacillus limi]|uniref:Uncharacterized protein n=1 Tax=Oceanobacillus limi TaxID=930131 RepID=A0A1I0C4Z4_9BACI|nr:hypothetical protein [Oceanobacillus limi]SET13795.1 hypothetical protein SAMN05216389_1063 [Oceanobacillus limi]